LPGRLLLVACLLSRPTAAAAQELRVVMDTTYYRVVGSTRWEWRESKRVAARRAGVTPPFTAQAQWNTRWWDGVPTVVPDGCVARGPGVELTVHYTMPHFVPGPETAPEEMREGRRYIAALWEHEEGHAARGYRAAVEARDSLLSVIAPTCAELHGRLAWAVWAVKRKYAALDSAYDVRTDHGTLQGVTLLSERERRSLGAPYRDTLP
jgi:predicted secreted Zn-dependent protease